jgi:hypothetical protein
MISLNRYFDHDEFEHIHSAWYLTNNQIPCLDFFEQHHPLLWYLLAPFLSILGNSTETVTVLRLLMFAFILGMAFFTGLITEQVTRAREAGLISAIFILSSTMFMRAGVEIRPDVPEVFFGLVSIWYFLRYFQSARDRDIVLSSLAASIVQIYLFPNPTTGKPPTTVKKAFKAACRKAGILQLRFHDLRHTFASRLVRTEVDLIAVNELLGHSSVTITKRYTHTLQEQKQKAVELLTGEEMPENWGFLLHGCDTAKTEPSNPLFEIPLKCLESEN